MAVGAVVGPAGDLIVLGCYPLAWEFIYSLWMHFVVSVVGEKLF